MKIYVLDLNTVHLPDEVALIVTNVLVVVVDVDDGVGDTVILPVWILPIVTVEPITSVITCKVYVRTSFGCNSDKLKFPSVAFLYNTGDEGSMIE